MEFTGLGYKTHAVGQTGGRNGVAVLSRIPFEILAEALPGDAEVTQARYIEVAAAGLRAAGIYLPNGNSGGDAGFAYKLAWMDRLRALVVEGIADGSIRPCEPKIVVSAWAGAVGWILESYDPRGQLDFGQVAEQLIGLLLHGLAAPVMNATDATPS